MQQETKMFRRILSTRVDQCVIAREILEKVPLYYDTNQLWYKYNPEKYKWERTDETDILLNINRELEIANITQPSIKFQLLDALRIEARAKKPKELKPTQVQFIDKIIDVRTGEETQASKEYFTFNPLPHKIGNSEDTPHIDEFITSWVGTDKKQALLEWTSYHLLRSYPIHRVCCLNGSGRNGKSTFIQLVKNFLGEDNVTAGDFETVFQERFGTSYLHKKLGMFMAETNFSRLEKTSKFKSATGGDPINIEFKGKNGFTTENYAKITICTNSLPITTDKTDGFYRRWLIIDFPNKFNEKMNILEKIPIEEYENFARKCLRLLKDLLNNGTFTNEGSVEDRRELYEKISNPLQIFIDNHTQKSGDDCIPKSDFKRRYKEWAIKNGHRILTDRTIDKIMREEQEIVWTTHPDGSRERAWGAIRWKEQPTNKLNVEEVDMTMKELEDNKEYDTAELERLGWDETHITLALQSGEIFESKAGRYRKLS